MKISAETIAVLKNFAGINTNILFREGNVVATISAGKNVFARAEVAESFPKQFAVYDLNSLLALLTLTDDQDVEFGPSSLKITKDSGEFEYFYANEAIITAAPDKTIPVAEFYSFKLTATDINLLMKAAAIVSADTISIVGAKGKVSLIVNSPKNDTSNTYRKVIGESDLNFTALLDVERFKVIPGAYDVTVNQKFVHLKSATPNLQYWLAVNPTSVFPA